MRTLLNRLLPSGLQSKIQNRGTRVSGSSKTSSRRRPLFETLENRSLMAQLTFGTPLSLGSGVNTGDFESGPTTTADGLTLLYRHNQYPDTTEILEASRNSTSEPFGNVRSAGADVNAGGFPAHPEVSQDGLTLLFNVEVGLAFFKPRGQAAASRSAP